jgi:beta-phosphoglucomutase-like phosphatase (HAD superfamily)
VASGRAGNFGFVVGVDRVGQADALREHGADTVVEDLAELLERS